MKLSTVTLCLLSGRSFVGASVAGSSITHFKPLKIPFETLFNEDLSNAFRSSLRTALQEVGMVSITQVPQMKELKTMALSWDLHMCTQESSAAESHQYIDGSRRRTLATHTIQRGSPKIDHQTDSFACHNFDETAAPFRAKVDEVTNLFAAKLSLLLLKGQDPSVPLLRTDTNFAFETIADIVEHGEHLEHFHSYQRLEDENESFRANNVRTIDFHIDQGLFLIFSPGQMTKQDPSQSRSMSEGFIVQLQDGIQATVDFDEADDLVVLLGDGVNQYINPRLPVDEALRALPHALALPVHSDEEARVWYGRMVLPPASAIHPLHGKTFAELRRDLINASNGMNGNNIDILSLGCASSSQVARQLEEVSCTADTLMCWHKCMSLADFNVSEEICQEDGKQVFCIDKNGQLWDGSHGNFFPGCATNETEIGGGTVMYMFGFRFFLDGQRPYLNFFVEKWTLNTTAKFVGAMFAVFILGVLMEAVVKLRQKVILTARLNHWSASTLQKIVTLLHGCQEMFGFLLMLATMMFSVEFLLSAVLGLALGHALFSKIDGGKDTVHKKNKQYHLDSSSLQEVQDLPEQDAATTPLYPQRCYCNQPSVS